MRGLSLFVLVLAATAGGALLADYWSGQQLPAVLRQITLTTWLGLGVSILFGGLIVPLCRRLNPEALAAVIERKYPELAERLTTSVEVTHHHDEGNGSPTLLALLLRETEQQTSRLNFLPAVSPRTAGILAAAAGGVLLLLATPAAVWPAQFADLGRRLPLSVGSRRRESPTRLRSRQGTSSSPLAIRSISLCASMPPTAVCPCRTMPASC